MTPFLQHVARSLREKFGHDLSHVTIVCPNKRARLFLNEYLVQPIDGDAARPVWAPRYLTISELFGLLTPLQPADSIEVVCRIHEIYVRHSGSEETLDAFYGWGEKILADFDDVDKNMVDARALFTNLADLKALDSLDYIDDKMERALRALFRDFSLSHNSVVRTRFLKLWNALLPIYSELNAELLAEGTAYEGALCRRALLDLEQGKTSLPNPTHTYVMVGFNVLNRVEERLFSYLQKSGHALFYWDYDQYYMPRAGAESTCAARQEAGIFLQSNMRKFPGELPEECFDNFRHCGHIDFVAAPTENAQARYVTRWLRERIAAGAEERDIAIVLCNESLLQPVLYAIPEEVRNVNITKGFPLFQTPAYGVVEKAFESEYAGKEMPDVHTFLLRLRDQIRQKAMENPAPTHPTAREMNLVLYAEAYFQCYTIVERFIRLHEAGHLNVAPPTLRKLLRQVVKGTTIPFHGEPAVGIQIMGVLETRNLSFSNILMLSVNEKQLPKAATDNTLVPYNLKECFGLTTARRRTAVYAYYFYRLIQRAQHLTLLYNNASDGLVKGEKSRFLTQIEMESGLTIHHHEIANQPPAPGRPPRAIPKPADLFARLPRLSPSAINTYLRCQKQFCFRHVKRLKEPPRDPDVIEPNTLGTIFHRVAQTLYDGGENARTITADYIKRLLSKEGEPELDTHIRQAFAYAEANFDTVTAAVVKTYLKQLLTLDLAVAPFTIVGTEREMSRQITIETGGEKVALTLHGEIDRMDHLELDGKPVLRIIDYKTGGKEENKCKSWEEVFTPGPTQKHYVLQTFFYAFLTSEQFPREAIAPALIFIHKAAAKDYDPYIRFGKVRVDDFAEVAGEYEQYLRELLADIYDTSQPFLPTETADFCRTCAYRTLCQVEAAADGQ